ncbi:hypothetical protein B0H10DRAFT_2215195 [Mycena sp. CBHHK59/15]|nr:hypothetical protein B0H10DRAFT_2215195 [Mycena sp. CBHHK59/15]
MSTPPSSPSALSPSPSPTLSPDIFHASTPKMTAMRLTPPASPSHQVQAATTPRFGLPSGHGGMRSALPPLPPGFTPSPLLAAAMGATPTVVLTTLEHPSDEGMGTSQRAYLLEEQTALNEVICCQYGRSDAGPSAVKAEDPIVFRHFLKPSTSAATMVERLHAVATTPSPSSHQRIFHNRAKALEVFRKTPNTELTFTRSLEELSAFIEGEGARRAGGD